ncbi:hypothetical protein M422DRAFT_23760 [Sphaerobolus stellatus SS14]|nr:hypothetical protein M422DRAFT_23760 [Sphaerobolus stellatus SS14]
MSFFYLFAALFAFPLVAADVVPSGPAPGDIFKEGGDCTIEWTADTTGAWKKTNIELMTGPNDPMIHLTTVATVDGTDASSTSFTFPCPVVSPHAPIYFYQFTAEGSSNVTWTGRWSITDATGALSTPANAKQPNGDSIPWGQGFLATAGTPPPSTAPAGQTDGSHLSASGSTSNSSSTSSAPKSSTSASSSASSSASAPAPAPPSPNTSGVFAASTTPLSASVSTPSGFSTVSSSSPAPTGAATGNSTITTTNGALGQIVSPLSVLAAAILGAFML